jgi:hypothetical protein
MCREIPTLRVGLVGLAWFAGFCIRLHRDVPKVCPSGVPDLERVPTA